MKTIAGSLLKKISEAEVKYKEADDFVGQDWDPKGSEMDNQDIWDLRKIPGDVSSDPEAVASEKFANTSGEYPGRDWGSHPVDNDGLSGIWDDHANNQDVNLGNKSMDDPHMVAGEGLVD